jgi:hypothetical protein
MSFHSSIPSHFRKSQSSPNGIGWIFERHQTAWDLSSMSLPVHPGRNWAALVYTDTILDSSITWKWNDFCRHGRPEATCLKSFIPCQGVLDRALYFLTDISNPVIFPLQSCQDYSSFLKHLKVFQTFCKLLPRTFWIFALGRMLSRLSQPRRSRQDSWECPWYRHLFFIDRFGSISKEWL